MGNNMNNLQPVFMKLEKVPCLVVGGGKIALQKIHHLIDSKAMVTVVSPEISESINSLPVMAVTRCYQPGDIDGVRLVIVATDNKRVNRQVYLDTQKNGVLVNVVDQPELCTFYMGSVYQDGDLKVAISTNGKCPSFGTFLRDHIKNMSRGLWGKSLNQLALKRENIIRALSKYSDKKEVMGELVKQSFKKIRKMEKSTGKVFLVGAGPGDPELITAKGLRAIQSADVILHDALIHPYLVFEINPLAQKIFVGKREDKHSVSQESIHSIMVEEAAKGKMVVRLKGGDPFMFGRGGEEVLALAESNIPFEVIPGITAGLGAAAGFGIPLTHRDDATSTLFITGHQCRNKVSQDWKILAQLNTTLVFYMGTKRLTEIVMGLVENGKSKDTPIAIVQNATMLIQNISTSTLGSILKDIKHKKPMTPAVIIIGNVVNYHSKIQKCLDALPSEIVAPIEDMGFDIWKNKAVVA